MVFSGKTSIRRAGSPGRFAERAVVVTWATPKLIERAVVVTQSESTGIETGVVVTFSFTTSPLLPSR
jgi:hypothetical protein